MTKRLGVLLVVLVTLIVSFVCLRGCDKRIDSKTSSSVLPPNDVEKIVVNPDSHHITVTTPQKEETLFLPDRPSSIEIHKDGSVSVTSRQYGTELKPFGGVGFSDKWRLYAGVDLGYWKRLDGGLFVSGNEAGSVRLGAGVSYTLLSNTRLTLGVDNEKKVNLLLSVRL